MTLWLHSCVTWNQITLVVINGINNYSSKFVTWAYLILIKYYIVLDIFYINFFFFGVFSLWYVRCVTYINIFIYMSTMKWMLNIK